jgi:hypothetical protein
MKLFDTPAMQNNEIKNSHEILPGELVLDGERNKRGYDDL